MRMWTKLQIGFSIIVFLLMSVVNCTFGPYLPFAVPHSIRLHQCPTGGYSDIRCRPDYNQNYRDCGPGFECIRKSGLYELDPLFCGVCCPLKRQCPYGLISGPFCDYNKQCPRGFSCNKGVCCKTRKTKQFCPSGSKVGHRCSLEFPCKLGNICINGVCCSIGKFKPKCPESYFPLKKVTCSMTSQCPGQSICYKHTCCQHEKDKNILDVKVPVPNKPQKPNHPPVPQVIPKEPIFPQVPHEKPREPTQPQLPRGDGNKIPNPDKTVPTLIPVPPKITDRPKTGVIVNADLKIKSCPGTLRKVKDFTCDHLLGCPGNSQCISGICCQKTDVKPVNQQCPSAYIKVPNINCDLRQRCPGNSVCISGICCKQPKCPGSQVLVTHQSCDLGTCMGENKCISGVCCKAEKKVVTKAPIVEICPVGYRMIPQTRCDVTFTCPIDSLCIRGRCCKFILSPTKAPVPREFNIIPTVKPTSTPIIKTTQRPRTLPPAKSPFKIPTTLPQGGNVIMTLPPATHAPAPNIKLPKPTTPYLPPSLPSTWPTFNPLATQAPVPNIKQPKPTTPYLPPNLPSTWPTFNPKLRPTFPPATPPRVTFNPLPKVTSQPVTFKPTPKWTLPVVTFNPAPPSTPKLPPYIPPPKATPTFLPPIIIPTQPGIAPPPYKTIQTPPPINVPQNPVTKPPTVPPTVPDLMPPILSNIPTTVPPLVPYVPTDPVPHPIPIFPDIPKHVTPIPNIYPTFQPTFPPIVTPQSPIGLPPILTTPLNMLNQTYPPTFPPTFTPNVPISRPNVPVTPTANLFGPPLPTFHPKQSNPTVPPVVATLKPATVTTKPTTVNYNMTPPPILPPSSLRPYPGTFTPINITIPPYPFPPGVVSTSYSWWGMSSIPPTGPGMTTFFNQPNNVPRKSTPVGVTNSIPSLTSPTGVSNPVSKGTTHGSVTQFVPKQTTPWMVTYPVTKQITLKNVTKKIPKQTTPGMVTNPLPKQTTPWTITKSALIKTTPSGGTKYIPIQTTPWTVTNPFPTQTTQWFVTDHVSKQTTPGGVTKPIPKVTAPIGVTIPHLNVSNTSQVITTTRNIVNSTSYTMKPLPISSNPPSIQPTTKRQTPPKTFPTQSPPKKHNITTPTSYIHNDMTPASSPQPLYQSTVYINLKTSTLFQGLISSSGTTTLSTPKQPAVSGCPPGNISIPGLSCNSIYKCPAGSQCMNGVCCLSYDTVKVPACPVDFLSANPCPNPPDPDQCTVDMDCGPFMICCLTSCDRRVCKPIVSPKPSKPRK